ncbi:MAG: type II toxin-antitoxin system VapC family toxin [Propionibacteriaceae bacterium]|nr:type II toxin-antitoxin system VapC family toxin [Propionibacteriaceae bacterium]
MLVLDTNVISEAMRGRDADPRVIAWLRNLPMQPVTTVVNRAEILAGLALLPKGARRDRLQGAARSAFDMLGVTLPLMPEAADHYAAIVALRRQSGRPIGGMDALVAAICLASGARLATRDTLDFEGVGLDLINPWTE